MTNNKFISSKIVKLFSFTRFSIFFIISGFVSNANAYISADYDTDTRQLSLPSVVVENIIYHNVIILIGDVITVGGSNLLPGYSSFPVGGFNRYNSIRNQLTVNAVNVYGTIYYDVILNVAKVLSIGSSELQSSATSSIAAKINDNSFELIFEEKVQELSFVDATDVDNDGVDDVVISGSVDAYSQIGVGCCEVTAEQTKNLRGITPKIYLSNYGNPLLVNFPVSAKTNRTWAGKFFKLNNTLYYVHGRNGELGLPDQNTGEISQIYRISLVNGKVYFALIAEMPDYKTTTSIDIKIKGNSAEILQNNYDRFSSEKSIYNSKIYNFGSDEVLREFDHKFQMKEKIAHNRMIYSRHLPGYIIAATEVNKTNDGSQLISLSPASYLMSESNLIELTPVLFDNNHASSAIGELKLDNKIFIFDVASEFFGHLNGGWKGSKIAVYHIDMMTNKASLCLDICESLSISLPKVNYAHFREIDLEFDGVNELYLTSYSGENISIFHASNGKIKQKNIDSFNLQYTGWMNQVMLLTNKNLKCIFSLSSEIISNENSKKNIKVSTCNKIPTT